MNCIICADKVDFKLLEDFVGKSSSLSHVGTFHDLVSIKDHLSKRHDIDLIILDIEVPGINIFNFVNSFGYQANIIIVSSHDKYALKAFEFNIVDYLLKPFTYARFCKAVDKAVRYYANKKIINNDANEIFVKKESALIKLKIKDIIYIEALENYILLNTKNEKLTIHFTMKAILNQLPSDTFIRIHRSFIVNISCIKSIRENSLDLTVGNEQRNIPIGSSFRDLLLNRINKIV
jgi:DNA-binding LytR/AlgR family response regulator